MKLRNMLTPQFKHVAPHQIAWMRRSELDSKGVEIWEKPDGQLYAAPAGKPLILCVEDRRKKSG